MLRFLGFSAAVSLATAACGGGVSGDASMSSQSEGAAPPEAPIPGGATEPSGVVDSTGMNELARLDGYAQSMTSDTTTLYVGMQDGRVLAIPKAGGDPKELVARDFASYPIGIAVDDGYVYVSSLTQRNVLRMPKSGGTSVVLAEDIQRPYRLALDDANVYVADQGSAVAGGAGLDGKVIRVAKDGKVAPVALATDQQSTESIAVDDTNVYFSNGPWGDVNGSIRSVPKAGGDVKVLARHLESVNNFVIADSRGWFIDASTKLLSYVLLDGSEATPTGAQALSPFGLTSDGLSFFATTIDASTNHATLRRLDSQGRVTATLAEWTYAKGVMPIGSLATVTAPGKVFWVDLASSPAAVVRSTIRWAMRP